MKQEVDMLPKDQRKDALRRRREEKEIEHAEKVKKQNTSESPFVASCAEFSLFFTHQ